MFWKADWAGEYFGMDYMYWNFNEYSPENLKGTTWYEQANGIPSTALANPNSPGGDVGGFVIRY